MISINGTTAAFGLRAIGSNNGSIHPSAHSQCESKKINTLPLASLAPFNRARIRPSRFSVRSIRTFFNDFISSSNGFFKCSKIQIFVVPIFEINAYVQTFIGKIIDENNFF